MGTCKTYCKKIVLIELLSFKHLIVHSDYIITVTVF